MFESFVRCTGRGLILLLCAFASAVQAGERNGTEWRVTRGDTLYQIARTIYPDDSARQSRLRQDIMMLNPDNFGGNQISMQPGDILRLPQYVVDPAAASETVRPVTPQPATVEPKAEPSIQPKPAATETASSGRGIWVVQAGETLYSIGRSVFPNDTQRQSILRRDILKLNRAAFANGANSLAVGTRLALPNYVDRDVQARGGKGAVPAAAIASSEPATPTATAAQPVAAKPEEVTPTPAPEISEAQPEPEPEPVAQTSTTATSAGDSGSGVSDNGLLLSLGLSFGGDELVEVDNGFDITGGSGINLRLGYQSLPAHGSGYRAALGLQYHTVKDASLTDTYLQLAYQYRTDPFLYGVGIVTHSGAEVEDVGLDLDFESSTGLLLYLEGVGNSSFAGWGLSLTSREMEEKDTGEDVDASNAEIYYQWNF